MITTTDSSLLHQLPPTVRAQSLRSAYPEAEQVLPAQAIKPLLTKHLSIELIEALP